MYLHAIGTQSPDYAFSQAHARDVIAGWYDDKFTRRKVRALFNSSGIETRRSVLPFDGSAADIYALSEGGAPHMPGTRTRNRVFIDTAPELGLPAMETALSRAGFEPGEVTHLIAVSCTGFSNPGLDLELVERGGLPEGTERYHLGFMGCYAAIPGLRLARQIAQADPGAVVVVCSVELCSLHLQNDAGDDTLLGNALFADGAAAAIVSAQAPRPGADGAARPVLALADFATATLPQGRRDMAWEIGDQGFTMILSSYIPDIISSNLHDILDRAAGGRHGFGDADHWAIHPGGKMILDKAAETLGQDSDSLAPSRHVLAQHGNMSSATILYVLAEMQRRGYRGTVCAMAFGPGLTVELASGRFEAAGALASQGTGPERVAAE